MKLRFLVIFASLTLMAGLALADPCVKVRKGEYDACMKFSPSAKRDATKYGLQLGASFENTRQALLKQGWVLDEQSGAADDHESRRGEETTCGSGWDAVCQTAFRRKDVLLVLTLSGVNKGKPLIDVEAAEHQRATADFTRTLTTPSFVIRVKLNCAEGKVTCDDVTYVGTSTKTGKSIQLHGKTTHAVCADRVTPCRFQGYEFWNGKTRYRVLDDGTLSVTQQDKVLLEERGSWE